MELREYWKIIRRSLWLILLIPVVASLVTYYYAHKTARPIYDATATLLTTTTTLQSAPSAATLSAIINSQVFDQAVVEQFPSLILSPSLIGRLVQVQAQGNLVYVSATGPDQESAASLANSIAQTIVAQGSTFSLPSARVINPASPNTPPVIKGSKKSVIMSFAIGLILALGIAFMREYLDMRIKNEADLSRFLNIPVLGTVQEYKVRPKKGKKGAKAKQKTG